MPLPPLTHNMTVGLFGGSFDPAHEGHRQVSAAVRKILGLNKVIWLVSPQNPLKPHAPQPLQQRVAQCRQWAHPHLDIVSDIETQWASNYAIDTIARFQSLHRDCRFIWIMGSDSFTQLHRWRDWQEIMQRVAIAVYPRPGSVIAAGLSHAAQQFAYARCHPRDLCHTAAPAWAILSGPRHPQTSTQIRQRKD